jgi:hypothetical protein
MRRLVVASWLGTRLPAIRVPSPLINNATHFA